MCGIAAIISEYNIDMNMFRALMIETMDRGEAATGIWTPNIGVLKQGIKATEFLKETKELLDNTKTNIIVGHCRKPSGYSSPPTNNKNNHPLENHQGILVHNGSVDRMDKIKEYYYEGGCDSEVLLSYLTEKGLQSGLDQVSGSAAIIYIDKKNLNELYIWRTTSPLVAAYNFKLKTIIINSTEEAIENILPTKFDLFTSPEWIIKKIPEYMLYKIGIYNGKINMEKITKIDPSPWKYKSYGWQGNYRGGFYGEHFV